MTGQPVPPEFTVRMLVEYRIDGGAPVPMPATQTRDTVQVGEQSVVRMLIRLNNLDPFSEHQVRVAAVGANDLVGPWSDWSLPCQPIEYVEGAPGLAAVPAVISVTLR